MASEKINEILSDATTLEISSVLVESISGRKIPGIAVAFLETVHAWVNQFEAVSEDLRVPHDLPFESGKIKPEYEIVGAARDWMKDRNSPANKIETYEQDFKTLSEDPLLKRVLNTQAMFDFQMFQKKLMKTRGNARDRMHDSEINRLIKIQMRLAKLQGYFLKSMQSNGSNKESLDKNRLVNRDIQELRKLWDLKEGYIFAQNTVQLDGDIISRQNLRLYRDPLIKEHTVQLLDFHNKNVDVGMKQWHFIIKTIMSLAKAIGAKVVSPFK